MLRIPLFEYGRLLKRDVPAKLLQRLQKFDEQHANQNDGRTIFDWSRISEIRATNYVGVIQVEGLQVEILPKVATESNEEGIARTNLLVMLSHCRSIPFEERDLAALKVTRHSLLDSLISLFVLRLVDVLRQGINQGYVHQAENLNFIKGKLQVNDHIRRNIIHKEKVFCSFDEFNEDTAINRILKAACKKMLLMSTSNRDLINLRECLLTFKEVSDVQISRHDFSKVQLNRNNKRFEPLLNFARMILLGESSMPSKGTSKTFSLLFPMNVVFEEFIAKFMKKNAEALGLQSKHIYEQGYRKKPAWLLVNSNSKKKFKLKPDIYIEEPRVIIDTKWKKLKSMEEDSRQGVTQADMYQLYAYAHRFTCSRNIVLYPQVAGVEETDYFLDGEGQHDYKILIRHVDLSKDLRFEPSKKTLINQLKNIISINSTIPLYN